MISVIIPSSRRSGSPAFIAAILLSECVKTLWSPPGSQPKLNVIAETVPGAQLKIFPNTGHTGYIVNSKKIADYILSVIPDEE